MAFFKGNTDAQVNLAGDVLYTLNRNENDEISFSRRDFNTAYDITSIVPASAEQSADITVANYTVKKFYVTPNEQYVIFMYEHTTNPTNTFLRQYTILTTSGIINVGSPSVSTFTIDNSDGAKYVDCLWSKDGTTFFVAYLNNAEDVLSIRRWNCDVANTGSFDIGGLGALEYTYMDWNNDLPTGPFHLDTMDGKFLERGQTGTVALSNTNYANEDKFVIFTPANANSKIYEVVTNSIITSNSFVTDVRTTVSLTYDTNNPDYSGIPSIVYNGTVTYMIEAYTGWTSSSFGYLWRWTIDY